MARYGLVVDVTRCNGCYNCFLACKDEYCENEYFPYSVSQPMTGQFWMNVVEKAGEASTPRSRLPISRFPVYIAMMHHALK